MFKSFLAFFILMTFNFCGDVISSARGNDDRAVQAFTWNQFGMMTTFLDCKAREVFFDHAFTGAPVLEAGSAMGATIEQLLKDPRNAEHPINLKICEIGEGYVRWMRNFYRLTTGIYDPSIGIPAEHVIHPDVFNPANRITGLDAASDLRTVLKGYQNHFGAIYLPLVLHFFDPVEYLSVLLDAHDALKTDGVLCGAVIDTQGLICRNRTEDPLQNYVPGGHLWCGWGIDPEAAQKKVDIKAPYGFYNYQSEAMMRGLLLMLGFDVSLQRVTQKTIFKDVGTLSPRDCSFLSFVAKKKRPPDLESLEAYVHKAIDRRFRMRRASPWNPHSEIVPHTALHEKLIALNAEEKLRLQN